jgi:hypothetical protein
MFRLLTAALQKSLFKRQRNLVVASIGGVIVALLVLVVSTAAIYVLDKLWVVAANSVFGLYGFLGAVFLAGTVGAVSSLLLLRPRLTRVGPDRLPRTSDKGAKKLHELRAEVESHEKKTGKPVALPSAREPVRQSAGDLKNLILAALRKGDASGLKDAERLIDELVAAYPGEAAWATGYRRGIQEQKRRL